MDVCRVRPRDLLIYAIERASRRFAGWRDGSSKILTMRSHRTLFGVALFLLSLWGAPIAAQSSQPASTGRVVATITTLEGTVRMPGIQVELRNPDERIVIAKTETDGAGQVTFGDVP